MHKKEKGSVTLVIIIIILIFIAGTGVYMYTKHKSDKQVFVQPGKTETSSARDTQIIVSASPQADVTKESLAPQKINGWKIYSNPQLKLKLSHPQDWKVSTLGTNNIIVESPLGDYINITRFEEPETRNLNEIIRDETEIHEEFPEEFKIIESLETSIAGNKAYRIVVEEVRSKLKLLKILFIKNNLYHKIAYNSSIEIYKNNSDIVEEIIKSLQLQ